LVAESEPDDAYGDRDSHLGGYVDWYIEWFFWLFSQFGGEKFFWIKSNWWLFKH
jgi:hypothetical protein